MMARLVSRIPIWFAIVIVATAALIMTNLASRDCTNFSVMVKTGNSLDLAIIGDAFFVLEDPATQEMYFTRTGKFELNAHGQLALRETPLLVAPRVTCSLPLSEWIVTVSHEGEIVERSVMNGSVSSKGQLNVVTFDKPEFLQQKPASIFVVTEKSGTPYTPLPGRENGGQTIASGWLECNLEPPITRIVNPIALGFVVISFAVRLLERPCRVNDSLQKPETISD